MARESAELATNMTTRTWLAGQALAGLVGSARAEGLSTEDVGKIAVEFADATLRALSGGSYRDEPWGE